jgi:hypothetical protein
LDVFALGFVTLCTLSFLLSYVAGLSIFVCGLAFIVVYIPALFCLLTRESGVALPRLAFITVQILDTCTAGSFAPVFLRAHGLGVHVVPLGLSLSGCCHYCRLCSTMTHQSFLAISGGSRFIVAFIFRPVHIYAVASALGSLDSLVSVAPNGICQIHAPSREKTVSS